MAMIAVDAPVPKPRVTVTHPNRPDGGPGVTVAAGAATLVNGSRAARIL